jgi:Intracellular proteinase inhibitor
MNLSRLATTVILAACVVTGCSGSKSSPATTSTTAVELSDGSATEACLIDATSQNGQFSAALTNTSVGSGQVTWSVTITNTGPAAAKIYFATGRQVDVQLSKPDGAVVYQWSTGRTFQNGARCEDVPAGGTTKFTLQDDKFELAAGIYSAEVIVAGAPNPVSAPTTLAVT